MHKTLLLLVLLTSGLTIPSGQAQTALSNATHLAASSDNTGNAMAQVGTEVLTSTPGAGVIFEAGGSFEHVGQFYLAQDGIWNAASGLEPELAGTDYFGYAPKGLGAFLPYQGKGIQGASTSNGGTGAGQPIFGHLQLNSAGEFPVLGGMYVTHSLTFNASGPGTSNVITTPTCVAAGSPATAVVFSPTAVIVGADGGNYIDGFASVTNTNSPFALPLGDPASGFDALHSLTINTPTTGTVTARYRHSVEHSTTDFGPGIGSVASIGNWVISAPSGTKLSVSLPALGTDLPLTVAAELRLVGWNGSQWIDLSGSPTPGSCLVGNCPLQGILKAGITDLAIGATSRVLARSDNAESVLTLWPNPVQSSLNLRLSAGTVGSTQVLDLQGRRVLGSSQVSNSLDAAALPGGTYILEVKTTQGKLLHKTFVKQP